MNCPQCKTEINQLKKNFPAWDFIITLFVALAISFIPVFGLGIGLFIMLVWIAWYYAVKPDRCPLCDVKIKFDKETKSLVLKK